MRTTKQLSVTIPISMADALKQRVESGAYASESEVVRDGLRTLFARDEAVETWLRTEAAAAYDDLRTDPAQSISADAMRARLAAVHTQRLADNGS
ncbi:ribbon-helix-helix domain-containing protein [Paeniglutamicibacter gangotriensis]|uniref:Putative transcriptional regulators containing the CopG/Arc/MetJ DNA-binding domain protein n=1 Tax=Paeniglutamicibacter gangotriensis Lz1y TaxID=1276920 RepID=M7MW79_9MICC|nr:type II toxin-antitoxin system ParD family antitoxin [Paeniglutamicibacter gangotriensis]EMQ99200.1 putative transcriptional regulators containing the CopG/Arc/MetJ DNA-binding domain protein [Paeniglutamicibacter gangotriensis Lz1y]